MVDVITVVRVTPDYQEVGCFEALNNSFCSVQAEQILLITKDSASLHQKKNVQKVQVSDLH